ncbi:phage GP46 family protein [Rhodopseudomonas palustris]|uniref:phage GP46 family protein n=1 Tax=Rhodopseudomonas palustris TaxID=1076 RepID=UPI000CECB40E|nr:phage GP46 family protein [Rhodopseudomonas palustris]PPQ42173.1 hypothetical protein CKO39_18455 [Rhodopseudomonas palustris]
MAKLQVRIGESSDAQPNLGWDTIWSPWGGCGDWAIAGADEPQNRGGLRAKAALHTAVIIQLFTDRRIEDDHPLRYLVQGDDPRGWWGDGVDVRADLHETELGSLLWVFERAPLTEEIRQWVERLALEALQPLIDQGAAAKIKAQAVAQFALNRCDLAVQIYGRDGARVYDQRFEDIWRQSVTSPAPPDFNHLPSGIA